MGTLHQHGVRLLILATALVALSGPSPVVAAFPQSFSRESAVSTQVFVVGDGTPASCTQDALQIQLSAADAAGGGTIVFNCGLDPAVIPVSAAGGAVLSPPDNTTIDGGGRITWRAATSFGVPVSIDAKTKVVLKNLAIVSGGGLFQGVVNAGTLTIWNCTLSGFSNGVVSSTGTLRLINSTFSDNGRFFLSAVTITSGAALVDRGVFVRNNALIGGAITNGGLLDVTNSTFSTDAADSPGAGGAISNVGTLTIENSKFAANVAGIGGALVNQGSLRVKNSTFSDNRALAAAGGGVFSGGTATIESSDFLNNAGGAFGGGMYIAGTAHIRSSTLSGNRASKGGGIYMDGDALVVQKSTVITNAAKDDGGGIFVAAGSLTLHHTLVIENTPNDIGPSDASISRFSSGRGTVDRSMHKWLKDQITYGLTVSAEEVPAWRERLRQRLQR